MGKIYGDGPVYSVNYEREEADLIKSFEGDRAFSDASVFYDELKQDLLVGYLDMVRLDGGAWVWVHEPMRRNADNDWQPD